MAIIYRGVSRKLDELNGGKIVAKGDSEIMEVYAGSTDFYAGSSFGTIGPSRANAQIGHSLCSDRYKQSYVSFTYFDEAAKWFATGGDAQDGWIYVTDTDLLNAAGIPFFANIPGVRNGSEQEIQVSIFGRFSFPEKLILDKYEVLSSKTI